MHVNQSYTEPLSKHLNGGVWYEVGQLPQSHECDLFGCFGQAYSESKNVFFVKFVD